MNAPKPEEAHVIFVVSYLLLLGAWIGLTRKYRTPENRDKRAVIVGTASVLFVLVTGFISDVFLGVLIGVPTALIGGSAAAAVVNWFSKRRGHSKEG